ncbi:KinB-signaling pathway activation protein [Peribacillus asahii]|uniref:Uncharacterized protein n=1 Tax=Peribacillus asahii TaxID=228899 RepID=A0A3Q9RJZ1_9BACI|nr:KinB-signaling pathway activation protein [Peribacillus asahii]AZV40900.1 hypothetical protein BAOM_0177 [Peribacillus asahii]USK85336.1 KinB-signaling pathway activation protein [Peribacillus asahii]
MNSRNVVRLFMTTLLVGGFTGALAGFIVRWDEFQSYFTSFQIVSIFSTFIWLFGVGLIFSVISQAGFFAYLTIHRFGLGIFKSVSLWNAVQVLLLLFVLGDFVYLRYTNFESGEGLAPYILLALFLLGAGLIVAYFKMKQTNKQAFIPALFFMVVATIIEWTPVLKGNDEAWLYFMLFPLLFCNAYQLLILNKLINLSQQELASKRTVVKVDKKMKNVVKGQS